MTAPTTAPRITRDRWVVLLLDGTEHEVTTILADQVEAERQLRKRGTGLDKSPLEFQSARVWHALVREAGYTKGLDEFYTDCADYQKTAAAEPVDPTQPAESPDSA